MIAKHLAMTALVLLTACSEQSIISTLDECKIIKASLPDFHASPKDGPVVVFVSDEITARGKLPDLNTVVAGDFDLWVEKDGCEFNASPSNCLELSQKHNLDPKRWPKVPAKITVTSLNQCGSTDFNPEVTTDDWETLFGSTVVPNVTPLHLFKIERIVTSLDGARAIATVQYECGMLCGEGFSLLLEKTSLGWVVIGKQPHWIS